MVAFATRVMRHFWDGFFDFGDDSDSKTQTTHLESFGISAPFSRPRFLDR